MSDYRNNYRGHRPGGGLKARKGGNSGGTKKKRKRIYETKVELLTTDKDGLPVKTINQLKYEAINLTCWSALFASGKATRMKPNGTWYWVGL